jgi:CYTH domain-containing protein
MIIRRRFLIASSLARLILRERGGLRQIEGFFPERQDRISLIRLEENRALLILRTAGPQGDVEEQTEVPIAHAHALLDVCAGEIDYTRAKLALGHCDALVDQFIRPRTLPLVTVEFGNEGEAKAFRPLPWFGPEVTGDARFTHQALALKSFSEASNIPISDAALNSLLDTLDNRVPAQPRIPVSAPTAKQGAAAKASTSPARAGGQAVKFNLDELEDAMRREMERSSQNTRPS